ncbi:LysM peptidoglycan-binding domain-containing protein [Virgibacillus kekensis]|uniref:LysM peptidoglycan-binding domain-containing protein n=1 Tax=Virgibacillus kekensis TaxID=202261 RepID=A0ABV9DGS7_9BACI
MNKKIFMSVTASAVIASAFVGTEQAEAASYKVKSGDSLWGIAQQYNTSISQLKSINGLSGNIIYPNQVIETSSNSNSTTTSSNTSNGATYTVVSGDTLSEIARNHNISLSQLKNWNNLNSHLIYPGDKLTVSKSGSSSYSAPKQQVASSSVYTVRAGDTLSGIGSRHGVSVSDLKRWNGLSGDLIIVGQKLNVGGSSSNVFSGSTGGSSQTSNVDYNVSKLVSSAKSVVGVNYAWGGDSPAGFDCSGFIFWAYNQAGMDLHRTSAAGYYTKSFSVSNPQVGDLVFFEGTYKAGISHMGIYVGNNKFIHASSDGVQMTSLSNSYWSKHFAGYKRFH